MLFFDFNDKLIYVMFYKIILLADIVRKSKYLKWLIIQKNNIIIRDIFMNKFQTAIFHIYYQNKKAYYTK